LVEASSFCGTTYWSPQVCSSAVRWTYHCLRRQLDALGIYV
jgi:hypothetical protein